MAGILTIVRDDVAEMIDRLRQDPKKRGLLVGIYRDICGLPNGLPRDIATGGLIDEETRELTWQLRKLGLMGFWDGRPSGLTKLGARVAAELNKDRTRQRQARDESVRQHNRDERRRRVAVGLDPATAADDPAAGEVIFAPFDELDEGATIPAAFDRIRTSEGVDHREKFRLPDLRAVPPPNVGAVPSGAFPIPDANHARMAIHAARKFGKSEAVRAHAILRDVTT